MYYDKHPITLLTDNTPGIRELVSQENVNTKYIVMKVFPNNAYYWTGIDGLPTAGDITFKQWTMITEEDFILAITLNTMGGYDYVHEAFKESLKDG